MAMASNPGVALVPHMELATHSAISQRKQRLAEAEFESDPFVQDAGKYRFGR
jgi:hypothetical protein